MSLREAAAHVGLKYRTAQSLLLRYLRNGCRFRREDEPCLRTLNAYLRVRLLPHEDYIRSNLFSWRFDSLERRVRRIREGLGVSISRFALSEFYNRLGIRYRRPNYHISNIYSEGEMKVLQQDFSIKLNDFFRRNVELFFFDECSTNFWERRSKLWMDMKAPYFLNLRYQRGSGCAILGAISTK